MRDVSSRTIRLSVAAGGIILRFAENIATSGNFIAAGGIRVAGCCCIATQNSAIGITKSLLRPFVVNDGQYYGQPQGCLLAEMHSH